ncbi:MAG TPA: uracil-DNA glycosylase family protein [Polyangiaceae bacterium]
MHAPSPAPTANAVVRKLRLLHAELDACKACPKMIGPVVHGPPVASGILLVGQAPGPREGSFGKPFAWTAGKTMFRWFEESLGVSEEEFRAKVYMAAVARCFPGKAPGGGDRRPDAEEIVRCKPYLVRETEILAPKLVLAVGTLAIDQVLGTKEKLTDLIGSVRKATYHGVPTDVVALPHPSGASPWHRIEPGKTLLKKALEQIAKHPETKRTFGKG